MIKAKKPTGTLDLGLDTAVCLFSFTYGEMVYSTMKMQGYNITVVCHEMNWKVRLRILGSYI